MLAASESNENLRKESNQSTQKPSKKKSGVGFANLARTIGTGAFRRTFSYKNNLYSKELVLILY
jgi:hypothetical protein